METYWNIAGASLPAELFLAAKNMPTLLKSKFNYLSNPYYFYPLAHGLNHWKEIRSTPKGGLSLSLPSTLAVAWETSMKLCKAEWTCTYL